LKNRPTQKNELFSKSKTFLNNFLEHFTATLALFEKMLPEYYSGAVEVSQTPGI